MKFSIKLVYVHILNLCRVSKGVKAQWVLLDPLAHEVLLETRELKGQLETRVCVEKWDDKEQKEKMDLWV